MWLLGDGVVVVVSLYGVFLNVFINMLWVWFVNDFRIEFLLSIIVLNVLGLSLGNCL